MTSSAPFPEEENSLEGGDGLAWQGARGSPNHACLAGWTSSESWNWRIRSRREIWLWLNLEGEGLIWGESDRIYLRPGLFALTGGDTVGTWDCRRHAGCHHVKIIRMGSDWLRGRLGDHAGSLHGGLSDWKRTGGRVSFCGLMGVWEKDLGEALAKAAAGQGADHLLAEARILEWAAHRLCRPEANGQATVPHTIHAPVQLALKLLRARLDEPLDLAALGRQVGVSPHHLSRMVSAESGRTLQHHLRRMRIEHACELLGTGRANVTETALSCGYQSLSHFAKAFREETGASPSEWLKRQE